MARGKQVVREVARILARSFDRRFGGVGRGRPWLAGAASALATARLRFDPAAGSASVSTLWVADRVVVLDPWFIQTLWTARRGAAGGARRACTDSPEGTGRGAS